MSFTALLQAQQNLGQTVTSYLGVLGDLWNSVVDVASLAQAEDLFAFGRSGALPALDGLEALIGMPCNPPKTKDLRRELEAGGVPALLPIDVQPPESPIKKQP